jgi:hypothetical protein
VNILWSLGFEWAIIIQLFNIKNIGIGNSTKHLILNIVCIFVLAFTTVIRKNKIKRDL